MNLELLTGGRAGALRSNGGIVADLAAKLDLLNQFVVRGDIDALRPFYAPEVEFLQPGGPSYVGVDGQIERLRAGLETYRFHEIRMTWTIECDDSVAAEMWYSLEHLPTQRRAELRAMGMLRFRDGLVVTEHECFDMKEFEALFADA